MKKTSLTVLTLIAVMTTAGLVVADTAKNEATLKQIAGYRQWIRVNPAPVQVALKAESTATIDAPI